MPWITENGNRYWSNYDPNDPTKIPLGSLQGSSTLDISNLFKGMDANPAVASSVQATSPQTFNPEYQQTLREIARRRLGLGSLEEVSQRRIGEDYNTALGTLDKGRDAVLNRLKTNFADRGMLYSGANIAKQGEVQEDYLRSKGDLDTSKNRSVEDLQRDLANQRQELQNQEERANIDRTRSDVQTQLQQALQQAQAEILDRIRKMQPTFSATGELY